MAAQGHEQENTDQENDNRHADRCSGKQLEMKMPLAKKPIADAAEDRPSPGFQVCCYGGVDRRIYHNCDKAAPLPPRLLPMPAGASRTQSRVSTRSSLSTNPLPARQIESYRCASTSTVWRFRLGPSCGAPRASSRRPSGGPFCKEN